LLEEERRVNNDWTIQYQGRFFQIRKENKALPRAEQKVTIRRDLEGILALHAAREKRSVGKGRFSVRPFALDRLMVCLTIEFHSKEWMKIFTCHDKVEMGLKGKSVKRIGNTAVFDWENIRNTNLREHVGVPVLAHRPQLFVGCFFSRGEQSLWHGDDPSI